MKDGDGNSIIRDYESIINRISGVNAAKILTDEKGNITEIHVLADTSRSPKQIVRDIESAIVARYGSEIDHKKISVAQIENDAYKESRSRLRLLSINTRASGSSANVEVELADQKGNIYRGSANGASSYGNRQRLVVKATLETVKEYIKNSYDFAIEDVSIVCVAKEEAVVVGVMAVSSSEEEFLMGSALIKKDIMESAVRATLDALNRRILV